MFGTRMGEKKRTIMEQIHLMPGQDRYVYFQDASGSRKLRYSYCSLRGRMFHCVSGTLEEAQRRCEDWLVTQDRCYRN